jgi:putative protein kinase ArgK-like GTPase of G3E family
MQAAVLEWVGKKVEAHHRTSGTAYLLGITGAQGTGKTTPAGELILGLVAMGYREYTF